MKPSNHEKYKGDYKTLIRKFQLLIDGANGIEPFFYGKFPIIQIGKLQAELFNCRGCNNSCICICIFKQETYIINTS